MQQKIDDLLKEVERFQPSNPEELEAFRIAMLGRKGAITQLFDEFKNLPGDQKRALGKPINALKQAATDTHKHWQAIFQNQSKTSVKLDLTRTATPAKFGRIHPLAATQREIEKIFAGLGFHIEEGPELEDDWHVFSALNFPHEHPARDMQDTFFIARDPDVLLRTHTSSVQVRVMENTKPPIRVICPGRVFRNEDISARAHCQFHQVEGLYVDRNVSFADLKQALLYFAQQMFGSQTKIRLRPSFFPFTEPSAEVDVNCNLCGGTGCNVCKGSGWVEILGAGMVDPNVLRDSGIDPAIYSGYAFGMGVERVTMLKYRINDLRLFFENDLRFLEQF